MNASKHQESIDLERFDYGIVRRKVRQLIGNHGFREQDREQLEQELIMRILQGFKSYDPTQSHRNAFVTTIVERSVASIIRDKCAEKRDHRRVSSIHNHVHSCNGQLLELVETLDQNADNARRGRQPIDASDHCDLACDLDQLLSKLPEDLRKLAEALKHHSVSEISREWGVPRTTLRQRVLELRRRFEEAGMRLHL